MESGGEKPDTESISDAKPRAGDPVTREQLLAFLRPRRKGVNDTLNEVKALIEDSEYRDAAGRLTVPIKLIRQLLKTEPENGCIKVTRGDLEKIVKPRASRKPAGKTLANNCRIASYCFEVLVPGSPNQPLGPRLDWNRGNPKLSWHAYDLSGDADPKRDGQRVTVVHADLRELDRVYQKTFRTIVETRGAVTVSFGNGRLTCVFENSDAATNSINAMRSMVQVQHWLIDKDIKATLRVGIESGPAELDYDPSGTLCDVHSESIDAAIELSQARISSLKPHVSGLVALVGQRSHQLCNELFYFQSLRPGPKAKSIHQLETLRGSWHWFPRTMHGAKHIDFKSKVMTSIESGLPKLFLIGGESGSGKSRLCHDILRELVVAERAVIKLTGGGHDNRRLLASLIAALRRFLSVPVQPTKAAHKELRDSFTKIGLTSHDSQMICDWMQGNRFGTSGKKYHRLLDSLVHLMIAIAKDRSGLTVVIDDWSSCDETTQRLLATLHQQLQESNVAITVVIADQDLNSELPQQFIDDADTIILPKLRRDELSNLAEEINNDSINEFQPWRQIDWQIQGNKESQFAGEAKRQICRRARVEGDLFHARVRAFVFNEFNRHLLKPKSIGLDISILGQLVPFDWLNAEAGPWKNLPQRYRELDELAKAEAVHFECRYGGLAIRFNSIAVFNASQARAKQDTVRIRQIRSAVFNHVTRDWPNSKNLVYRYSIQLLGLLGDDPPESSLDVRTELFVNAIRRARWIGSFGVALERANRALQIGQATETSNDALDRRARLLLQKSGVLDVHPNHGIGSSEHEKVNEELTEIVGSLPTSNLKCAALRALWSYKHDSGLIAEGFELATELHDQAQSDECSYPHLLESYHALSLANIESGDLRVATDLQDVALRKFRNLCSVEGRSDHDRLVCIAVNRALAGFLRREMDGGESAFEIAKERITELPHAGTSNKVVFFSYLALVRYLSGDFENARNTANQALKATHSKYWNRRNRTLIAGCEVAQRLEQGDSSKLERHARVLRDRLEDWYEVSRNTSPIWNTLLADAYLEIGKNEDARREVSEADSHRKRGASLFASDIFRVNACLAARDSHVELSSVNGIRETKEVMELREQKPDSPTYWLQWGMHIAGQATDGFSLERCVATWNKILPSTKMPNVEWLPKL